MAYRLSLLLLAVVMLAGLLVSSAAADAAKIPSAAAPIPSLLASGLEGASGSTIGPGGALYVTEGAAGRISRVDPQTGDITTFAEGLPPALLPIGGANDLVFIGETAYVLVTMVGDDLPIPVSNGDVVGIYRVDGPSSFTVIADIGQWSIDNPSESEVFIPSGVHYAMETFHGGFLVTDGHHNRVLHVTLDGEVSEMIAFDNIVPTGLEVRGNTVYMAEAGPNPHLPADGKVVAFGPQSSTVREVASGAPLLVDVEYGRGSTLYALAQGDFPEGSDDGSPALPNTGSLVEVNGGGAFTTIVEGLDRPTSLEFIGNTAYVVTLTGEVWKIDDVSNPPFGTAQTAPLSASTQDCPWAANGHISACYSGRAATVEAAPKPSGLAAPDAAASKPAGPAQQDCPWAANGHISACYSGRAATVEAAPKPSGLAAPDAAASKPAGPAQPVRSREQLSPCGSDEQLKALARSLGFYPSALGFDPLALACQ